MASKKQILSMKNDNSPKKYGISPLKKHISLGKYNFSTL